MIYLDHPATSWPKPPSVIQAMNDFLEKAGGNPGRSGHSLSIAAGRVVYDTREALAHFFGAPKTDSVIFTHNATHALNMVIQTVLKPGDKVVTTCIEHNSVMRPLRDVEKLGVQVLTLPCSLTGAVHQDEYCDFLKRGVRLVVLNHASNVIGQITEVAALSRVARAAGAMILLDAAQTAGVIPINAQEMEVDYIAFTGHKALLGPPGTGGLILCTDRAAKEIGALISGGTGSRSQSEHQPDDLPDKLESGTPNGVGIAGLGAAIDWINEYGMQRMQEHHTRLIKHLVDGLAEIGGVEVFGPPSDIERAPLVSFQVKNKSVSEVGLRLDNQYDILCRVGLHCAPAAHRTLGTFPDGAIRFGVGPFTSDDDIDFAIKAVREIASND